MKNSKPKKSMETKKSMEKTIVETSVAESHEEKGNIKIIGVIIASLLLLSIIFLVVLKFNLMISEQLRIVITPEYSEFTVESPGTVSLSIDMSLYNKFFCGSTCTYTLKDLSHNVILDTGSFNSRTYTDKDYSFSTQVQDKGYGRNLYAYDVVCVNAPKTLCPSENDSLIRRAIFVVDYTPTSDQLSALDYSKEAYTNISKNLLNASKLLSAEQNIIFTNNSDNITVDTKIFFNTTQYYFLKYQLDTLVSDIPELMDLWKNDEYIAVKEGMVEKDMLGQSQKLIDGTSDYYSYLMTTINTHNSLIAEMINLNSRLDTYRFILNKNIAYSKNSTLTIMRQSIIQGNVLTNSLNSPTHDYDSMYNDLAVLKTTMNNNDKNIISDTLTTISMSQPSLYVYTKLLCLTSHTNNADAPLDCNVSLWLNDIKSVNDSVIAASNLLDRTCSQSLAITKNIVFDSVDINSSDILTSGNDSAEALLFMYASLKDYDALYSSNSVSSSPVSLLYSDYIKSILIDKYNLSDPDTTIANKSFNSSMIELDKTNKIFLDISRFENSCYNAPANITSEVSLLAKPYNLPVIPSTSANSLTLPPIPEILSKCCVYNKCQSCEKKSNNNPLILLHGHSLNQKTNAYMSIEIFNDFEQAFIDDELYYPTGLLVKNDNSTAGILGHHNIPTISKSTYYLDTYKDLIGLKISESKTGNIDTYALRLKETIDYTKYLTGSDKVDIVAHSMGGLVVRRYMQIFGINDVDTIVLIATPNNGVSEKTYSLCKILGATNECDDMRSSSLFLKKLNDYSSSLNVDNLYLVIGKGCDTDSLDGDGVVSVNNSLLRSISEDHVLYVNGTCSGTTTLHNELLKTNKYPQVYEFVKEKLG